MNLNKCLLTKNECYIIGRKIKPKGIMWHCTGAKNPWLKRYVQPNDGKLGKNMVGTHWNKYRPGGRQVCVHAFIGKLADGSVATYQTLPWDHRGWHGGKSASNNRYIGFEMCEDGLRDKEYFNAVYKEAVELTAYLCEKYNLDPMGKNVIICHQDGYKLGIASNHGDVYNWFKYHGKTMDDVRRDVAKAMGKVVVDKPNKPASKPESKPSKPSNPMDKGYLCKGDIGQAVKDMQHMLNACGFDIGEAGVDGSFGQDTVDALKSFQKAHKLKVDGFYGAKSQKALKDVYNALNSKPRFDKVKVDGYWGDATTELAQKIYGTYVDGDISNQPSSNRKYLESCYEESWKFKRVGYKAGSSLIKAIQKDLKGHGYYHGKIDGWCGKNNVIALQKFLNDKGFNCGNADGYCGKKTVIAFQKYLNNRI